MNIVRSRQRSSTASYDSTPSKASSCERAQHGARTWSPRVLPSLRADLAVASVTKAGTWAYPSPPSGPTTLASALPIRTAPAHFMARCRACTPSMPNTYLGRRQLVFKPVICRAQPQSEPGTSWGTPIVSTTGFPLGDLNTRRAAIRRMIRGASKDLLIWLSRMVSGHAAQRLYPLQPVGDLVPTGENLAHHQSPSISRMIRMSTPSASNRRRSCQRRSSF